MTRRVYTPRAFFAQALDFLASANRNSLWAGMGMGKTSIAETWLDIHHNVLGESDPTLVLGPLRVAKRGWTTEAAKWEHLSDLSVSACTGDPDQRERVLADVMRGNTQVMTLNYENIVWLVDTLGPRWPFRTVIPDEATKLKGFRLLQGTKRAQALASVAHSKVKYWKNLTGAPAPNGLKDLWGQQWFIDEGVRLGRTFDAFEQRWFGYRRVRDAINPHKEHIQTIIFPHSQDDIMSRLQDVCLTLDPKDWFPIDELRVVPVPVELEPSARAKYRALEKELFLELGNGVEIEVFSAASKSSKCLQAAGGAVYLDPERYGKDKWVEVSYAKIDALDSVINELGGAPLMISYNYKHEKTRIMKAYPQAVDLATEAGFEAFMDGRSVLGLCHPQSLGHGVDGLQDVCWNLCFFGQSFDLDTHDQLLQRIGPVRQLQSGHNRVVSLYYLVAEDTVDEVAVERRASKRSVQDLLLDYMNRKENQ